MSGTLRSIVRQVCPRCREGAIYRASLWRGYLAMHEKLPGVRPEIRTRAGLFSGRPVFQLSLSIPPGLAIVLLLWRWTGLAFRHGDAGAFFCYLPLVPVVTRWARVLWIYVDQHFDPDQ